MQKRLSVLFLAFLVLFGTLNLNITASEAETNLAEGLQYTVMAGEPITHSYALFNNGGLTVNNDNGQLTDAKLASADSSDDWYRAYMGKSRVVSFDLGEVCTVTRVEAGFLHAIDKGIFAPRYINVYLSDDGESFGKAAEYSTPFDQSSTESERVEFAFELNKLYSARYVRVEFCCDNFAFCDEIRLFGTCGVQNGAKKVIPDKADKGAYLGSVSGLKNTVKLYNGKGVFSEDALLPYIAYVGTSGTIDGRMFDSAAILPQGGALGESPAMQEWVDYRTLTFSENGDLAVINRLVGRVYDEIGVNKKFGIFLALPYPAASKIAFGDIDGDGEADYCRNADERAAVIKWYADSCVDLFRDGNFSNLFLAGFYWANESICYSAAFDEADFVKNATKHINRKGLETVIDFKYLATGFDHWEDLGFGGAVMRPNAAFAVSNADYYFHPEMFLEFAQTALNNYLGVGIETDAFAAYDGINYFEAGRNYERYLFYGYNSGYSNSFKTYSQGEAEGAFYKFCYSDINTPKGQYLRRLYDLTYKFIRGVYKNDAPLVTVSDIKLVAGDSRITTDIFITDEDSYRGDLRIEIPVKPQNGSVAVASNKESLVYRANEGFVGSDSFTVLVSDGFNYSEEVLVNVTVSAPEPLESSAPDVSEDMSDNGSKSDGMGGIWLWLVAGAAILAVTVVVVALTKRSKK